MELAADLTRRLDGLESGLPPAAGKLLHLQRTAVSSAAGLFRDAGGALGGAAGSVAGVARQGFRTVVGQARHGVQTTSDTAGRQARTVAGQAAGQGERLRSVVSDQVEDLAERAADRVEDAAEPRYESWTRAELLGRARELDVDGRTRMSKAELVAAIRAAQ